MRAVIFAAQLLLGLAASKDFCKQEFRNSVEGAIELDNGTLLTSDGDLYPAGTFWKDNKGHMQTCPCLLGPCIRICERDFAEHSLQFDHPRPIAWNEFFEKNPTSIEKFRRIESECKGRLDILKKGEAKLLASGQIQSSFHGGILDAERFCFHQEEGDQFYLMRCTDVIEVDNEIYEEAKRTEKQLWLYRIVSCLSAACLLLTMLAYMLSPQATSIHVKCVIRYSACLAVTFIGSTLISFYRFDQFLDEASCILFAYIPLYGILASLFWLSAMCIDIFLTFKGAVRKQRNYFARLSIYSFGAPLAIVAVALIFNLISVGKSIFNPTEGINPSCWIEGREPELLYYHVPSLLLLLVCIGLLFAACTSRGLLVHAADEAQTMEVQEEKKRRTTYILLTGVAGFVVITDVLMFFAQNFHTIFVILSFISKLQGVFVFLLLVCADQNARSLFCRVCRTQRAQIISSQEIQSMNIN